MEQAEPGLTETLHELEALRDEIKERNIGQWKQRLQQSQSQRHKWLKGMNRVPTLNLVSSKRPDLPMSRTATEAVDMLARHWRTVWGRPCDWRRGLDNLMESGQIPRGQQMSYKELDCDVVKSIADKMRSKAAGADGWSGSEVADLPVEIWQFVVKSFTWFESINLVPDVWKLAKQTHIPKTGMDPSMCHDCKNFKLITMMSVWYRIWGSSRLEVQWSSSGSAPDGIRKPSAAKALVKPMMLYLFSMKRS